MKELSYKNINYITCEQVYEPSDDSFLLIDNLLVNEGDKVLELGTGTGLVSIFASKKAAKVIATDISSLALSCAKKNFELNRVSSKIDLREGSIFEPIIKGEDFDVILFNPPYLPSDSREEDTVLTRSWSAGKDGRIIIDDFLKECNKYLKENGKILLIQSSLSNTDQTINIIKKKNMKIEKLAEKSFFYEKIILFLITK